MNPVLEGQHLPLWTDPESNCVLGARPEPVTQSFRLGGDSDRGFVLWAWHVATRSPTSAGKENARVVLASFREAKASPASLVLGSRLAHHRPPGVLAAPLAASVTPSFTSAQGLPALVFLCLWKSYRCRSLMDLLQKRVPG